ncbi:hypothetical protein PROFUN_06092 [Planoprotostelium fungivorum]|uniref:Uncharacterized protein n=1 Tax=Planoprotostelium fungivorum TaxID=1890364 RepID=A0A2P6NPT8_9EUKA|nr:hypothetical protein PROFUN_06092 [Planoprotostelium fungivorum]
MRGIIFLLLVTLCYSARFFPSVLQPQAIDFPVQFFNQTLDHFNPTDSRTFTQRYWVNDKHWSGGDAPIILYINGEGPVSGPPSASDDFVVTLADNLQATIVTLEHRYYGDSSPFDDLTVENLRYLTVEQALRDLENFVLSFREGLRVGDNANAEFKIFNIGVSYSGALSAWFRLKYPHVTEGSIASSGVVNAILEFDQFDAQIVSATGSACSTVLLKTMRQLESLISNNDTNLSTKSKFLADMLSDADFYLMMGDVTGELVQYGHQADLCTPLVTSNGIDLVEVLANITVNSWSGKFGMAYQYGQDHLKKTPHVVEWADRQWWWQTCTELAYFQVAPKQNSVRSSTVDIGYFRSLCSNVFGEGTWPNTKAFNNAYGGNQTAATKVFFSNGSQDPWKWASVTDSLGMLEPAVVISCDNCGHGVLIRGCPGGCSPSDKLNQEREKAMKYVQQWLL